MALRKSVDTGFGFNAEYWRVEEVLFNRRSNTGSITVGLYYNRASKEGGSDSLKIESWSFPRYTSGRDPESVIENPFTIEALEGTSALVIAYETLKLLPEFEGAEDVLEPGQVYKT